jgi:hypothetical protein
MANIMSERGILLSEVRDEAGTVTHLQISQGEKIGLIRSELFSTCFEAERFGAELGRCRAVWDYSEIVTTDDVYLKRKEFEVNSKLAPSVSDLLPGSAFDLVERETYDVKAHKVSTILPRKHARGYAYQVDIALLSKPAQWRDDVEAAGFVCVPSECGRYFHGASYPGGELGLAPPMEMIPWLSTSLLAGEGDVDGDRPAGGVKKTRSKGASSSVKGEKKKSSKKSRERSPSPTQSESSRSGSSKAWIRIPAWKSTATLSKAASKKAKADKLAEYLRNLPEEIRRRAMKADPRTARSILNGLKVFVEKWAPSGGQDRVTIPILFEYLRKKAGEESSYCKVLVMLNSSFHFDWSNFEVTTLAQHLERMRLAAESSSDDSSEGEGSEAESEDEAEESTDTETEDED